VWGVGCSEKEEYPYPKRYKAPALLYGKINKMCFARFVVHSSTASKLETPAFKYGVPHTPHPTPNKTVHTLIQLDVKKNNFHNSE